MKIRALPFLVGAGVIPLFTGNWEFFISAAMLLGLLVCTRQIDLY
jgi:hypothetical protein